MDRVLGQQEASAAVEALGWRYLLGSLVSSVEVRSITAAMKVAAAATRACGGTAAGHLRLVVSADQVEMTLRTPDPAAVTGWDVELAELITVAVGEAGMKTAPRTPTRSVQQLEVGIDALDIALIRPFWRAVLAYTDEPGHDGPTDPLVDPNREGPAVWFQQMDEPRPQRNRIHLDISVPHDEAEARVAAAIEAGGTLVSDARARAFWVLADAEGNEVCVCTWQDRD